MKADTAFTKDRLTISTWFTCMQSMSIRPTVLR